MNIAIVNDLDIEIEALKRLIEGIKGYNVIWIAKNGLEAIDKNKSHKPDLILMNLNMPIYDGAKATKIIMEENPVPIIIISSSINLYQSKIFEAMGYGALDVSSIPINDNFNDILDNDLLKKIDMIAKLSGKSGVEINSRYENNSNYNKIVLIGASTGGPKVIAQILESLPKKIDGSIIIVQHLDKQFTQGMVDWLNNYTKIPIKVAKYGTEITNNAIFLVGGNEHIRINKQGKFELVENQIGYHFVPSINILFQSFADNYNLKGMAMILTGMGNDGANGLFELKKKGWQTFAQDEKSSVVYGMPKAAYENGAADKKLDIEGLILALNNYLKVGD